MRLQDIIDQLTPANKRLAETLIIQLAERDGVDVNGHKGEELPDPITSIPLWVAQMKTQGKSPRTIGGYEKDARRYLEQDPHPTTISIQTHIAKRLETVTAARVSSIQKALKSLFKFLKKAGLWHINPCEDMELIKEGTKEIECPTDDEILILIGAKLHRAKDEVKYKVMLLLLVNTGLRLTEACSIERKRIDVPLKEIRVIGKGNKERIIPISDPIAMLLKQFMEQTPTTSPYLFPGNTTTGHWDISGFEKTLEAVCRNTGIKRLHPHQLRHYFATRMLEDGAKLEVVSRMLGHANVSITASVYRHIKLQEFHDELAAHNPLDKLPKLLMGGTTEGEFKEVPE